MWNAVKVECDPGTGNKSGTATAKASINYNGIVSNRVDTANWECSATHGASRSEKAALWDEGHSAPASATNPYK